MAEVERPVTANCVAGNTIGDLIASVFDPIIRNDGKVEYELLEYIANRTSEEMHALAEQQRRVYRRIVLIGSNKYPVFPADDREDDALSFDLVLSLPQKPGRQLLGA